VTLPGVFSVLAVQSASLLAVARSENIETVVLQRWP
jgi:hypothetical protein